MWSSAYGRSALGVVVLALAACDVEQTAVDAGEPTVDAAIDAAEPGPDAMMPSIDAMVMPSDAIVMPSDAIAADAIAPDTGSPDPDMAVDPDMAADPDMAPPDMEPDAAPEGPAVYVAGRTQSPITPWVADNLRAIASAAPRQDDVFSKIGASATVSRSFLHCFGGDDEGVDLDGRDALWDTIEHFRGGDADGSDPFTRTSHCATVGWSAGRALDDDPPPSPLQQEVDAADPRFAVVMYGTNDMQLNNPDGYAGNLFELVDRLTGQGVIPVLTAVMPRDDDPDADRKVPTYNGIIRGVAQARQVPFIDFHRELEPLPDHGLSGDRLHPSTYRIGGRARACDFGPEGLGYGYNIRNLVTLDALDRLRRVVVDGEPAPDAPHAAVSATGGPGDPIPITALPFTDARDTRDSPFSDIDAYPGCEADQDESGPEYTYLLELDRPTTIRAWVLDRGDVDVDIHLLGAEGDPATCLDRAHREITASLDPGRWWLVLDTFVSGGTPRSGPFLLVVVEQPE